MLEPQDIQKLMEVLATKEDIRGVSDRVGALETKFIVFEHKLTALDDRMAVMEEKQDKMITILDKIFSQLDMLNKEYMVLKERDSRYERWFHEIAAKVGVTLVP